MERLGKKHYFFVITGPSACGKTTLLRRGEEVSGLWVRADKISTRKRRVGDNQFDDIVATVSPQKIYSDSYYDYRYIMNGNIYAFSSAQVKNKMFDKTNTSGNVAIICSDLTTIKRLKNDPELGDKVIVLFIASVSDVEQVTKSWIERTKKSYEQMCLSNSSTSDIDYDPDFVEFIKNADFSKINQLIEKLPDYRISNYYEENSFINFSKKFQELYKLYYETMPKGISYKQRIRNIDKFYYKYIEEIGYFDYTILNFFGPEDNENNEHMTLQVQNILNYLDGFNKQEELDDPQNRHMNRIEAANNNQKYLFFICAPKMSGKSILFSNLNLLSKEDIAIVRKIALREDKNPPQEVIEKTNKGDGYGLSETYWMFDNDSNDEASYKEFNDFKEAYFSHIDSNSNLYKQPFEQLLAEKLELASDRVKTLISRALNYHKEQNPKNARDFDETLNAELQKEYDFTKWYWEFQKNYYAIDINEIKNKSRHSIIISNMKQLNEAKKYAEEAEKILVPIFLVYVDHKKRAEEYYIKYFESLGKNENDASLEAEKLTSKIYETIEGNSTTYKGGYFEHIGKFHHVILNTGIPEDVHDQISNILHLYIDNEKDCRK